MRLAIAEAVKNSAEPFGAVIVDRQSGEVVARGVNRATENPLMHGETAAIADLIERHGRVDCRGLDLYTTAEPCPMCAGAVLWTGFGRLIYGTSTATLARRGWTQIDLTMAEVAERAKFAQIEVRGGVLEAECDALFADLTVAARHLP